MTQAALTPADLRTAPVVQFDAIDSTNEEGLRRARANEHGPLWLRAGVQTAGRGRLGRNWSSPIGNLYASVLLDAPAEPRCMPQLAHVAAVALIRAVTDILGSAGQPRLKWPNDLLFGGAKVAGILIEATTSPNAPPACVIGWGVNCTHHPDDLPYKSTNLSAEAGRSITADTMFASLRLAMADALDLWDRGHGYRQIREAWLDHAFPRGTPMTIRMSSETFEGLFEGIDSEGRLLVSQAAGLRVIEAGDIFLLDRSAGVPG